MHSFIHKRLNLRVAVHNTTHTYTHTRWFCSGSDSDRVVVVFLRRFRQRPRHVLGQQRSHVPVDRLGADGRPSSLPVEARRTGGRRLAALLRRPGCLRHLRHHRRTAVQHRASRSPASRRDVTERRAKSPGYQCRSRAGSVMSSCLLCV